MACRGVYSPNDKNPKLIGKRFQSHAAVMRKLQIGESFYVQEINGNHEGWYRCVTRRSLSGYSVSIPLMDY